MRAKDIDKKIGCIKAMLSEFGNEMPDKLEQKSKLRVRKQLYSLYSQAIADTGDGGDDGGGEGAVTGATQPFVQQSTLAASDWDMDVRRRIVAVRVGARARTGHHIFCYLSRRTNKQYIELQV